MIEQVGASRPSFARACWTIWAWRPVLLALPVPQNWKSAVLTKRIVESMGGNVEVRSVPGAGSTFSAVLPREAPVHAHGMGAALMGQERIVIALLLPRDFPAVLNVVPQHGEGAMATTP